jgi:hypothetical protein
MHAFKDRCTGDAEFMRRALEFCKSPNYHNNLRGVVRTIGRELPCG